MLVDWLKVKSLLIGLRDFYGVVNLLFELVYNVAF
jgi:hypothetical protein